MMKRNFSDRSDGTRVKSIDPFFKIIPHIMKDRNDAQVFSSIKVDVAAISEFVKNINEIYQIKIGFLEIVIAAIVRTLAEKPHINRFVAGRKIYQRNKILVSFIIKKNLNLEGEETSIKLEFSPTDTIFEVSHRVKDAIAENKKIENSNNTDSFAKVISILPDFLLKFIVGLIKMMDNLGIMPKAINELSPFHTSIFITDLGSLGFEPIYHHLYNFGTTSLFLAFGARYKENELNLDHTISQKKYVDFKFVCDERICDGYAMVSAWKTMHDYLKNPEKLLNPSKEVSQIN